MKIIKNVLIIIGVFVLGFFAYDYYMRNSGVENRIQYEKQKRDMNQRIDNGGKTNKEIRQEKREKRREKIRNILN
jgi:hypothetical protein